MTSLFFLGSGIWGAGFGCTTPTSTEPSAETAQESETTDGAPADVSPENNPDQIAILKPKVIATISPEVTVFPLPEKLKGKEVLRFASVSGGDTLIGGVGGFFVLKEKTFTLASDQVDVIGIAPWLQGGFAVATSDRIYLWDSQLQTTLLHQQLANSPITALAAYREGSLWIGTRDKLWRYENERLVSFDDIKGVRSLLWIASLKTLIVKNLDGMDVILRQDDLGRWQQRSFESEGVALRETTAAWWPYRIQPNEKNEETLALQQIALEATSGFAWVFTPTELFRIEGDDASKMPRPSAISADISLIHSASDGTLWVADRQNLVRIGQATSSITYSQHIAPFLSKTRCTNCHASVGGQAFPLETYEQVKPRAQKIVDALSAAPGVLAMPPAGYPLVGGDAALIERWIKDGSKE
ncbi:hypothetical protein L6R29_19450 [Myxococcota bacterium]|nr:hypothetical protein [Myxococcota bacterium]